MFLFFINCISLFFNHFVVSFHSPISSAHSCKDNDLLLNQMKNSRIFDRNQKGLVWLSKFRIYNPSLSLF